MNNSPFIHYLINSLWMLSEQLIRIFSAVFVTIYIAKFLGPEQFGVLSYLLAILAILMAVGRLGMDSILTRELIAKSDKKLIYMGTSFWLMSGASLFLTLLFCGAIYFNGDTIPSSALFLIVAVLLQGFYVLDYDLQSQIKAKYTSLAKTAALVLGAGIKIFFVLNNGSLHDFILIFALEYLFTVIFLWIVSKYQKTDLRFFLYFDIQIAFQLLKNSWPMVLAAMSIILYTKMDQLMIKEMLDIKQLGLYSAAIKIYDGWLSLPYILSISVLPVMTKMRLATPENYENWLYKIFAVFFWLGVVVSVISFAFREEIVSLAFGEAYRGSETTFCIIMMGAAFTAISSLSIRYLTVENMEKKILIRTIVPLIINIFLNLILIPKYGINGSAIAVLVTAICAGYLIDFFDQDLQTLRRVKHRAIFLVKS